MGMDSKKPNLNAKLVKKIITIVIVVLAILGIGVSFYMKIQKPKVQKVTIAKVVKENLSQTSTVTGNVEAKYRNDIQLNPSQKVVKVLVKEGQMVKKGDILAQLDTSDNQTQLQKQKINMENARLTLEQLTSTGVTAEKSTSESNFTQEQVKLENAQRNYNNASNKFKQSKELLSGGYISQNEYDANKKSLEDATSFLREAQVAVASAKNSLNNVKSSSNEKIASQKNQIALIQSDIENINKKIQDSMIRANTSGKVLKLDAKENEFPENGDVIIVDDVSEYRVSVNLNQHDAMKVAKGQRANIKIKGSNKTYSGLVTQIGELAEAKITSGGSEQEFKVNVKVTMNKPYELIKAGYEADVEFIFDEKKASLSIGFDGIKEDKANGTKYVYAVNGNNKVSKIYIKTGIETQYYTQVLNGLKEGQKYILNPPETLHEGDVVEEAITDK